MGTIGDTYGLRQGGGGAKKATMDPKSLTMIKNGKNELNLLSGE